MSTIPGRRLSTSIPLTPGFRFAHEPLTTDHDSRQFVGREAELQALAERVYYSNGGSFLITGYRGVGKTSFVNRVIARVREIAREPASPERGAAQIVDIYMSIARPLSAAELMHHIVRRLYERLVELKLFDSLPLHLRDDITLAYHRTSMSITKKMAETLTKEYGVSEAGVAGTLLAAAAKFSWSRTESRSRDDEFSFLSYDDKAAEMDVLRIARQLSRGVDRPLTAFERVKSLFGKSRPTHTEIKVIFVFDELDKLDEEADAKKKPFLDRLLGDLKNLFTTSGLSFIFVAGRDLYDRWLADVGRGDSVYESVFCYDRYLPCMWEDVRHVCSEFIGVFPPDDDVYAAEEAFVDFLKYRGRGIPRRVVREFNQYVQWSASKPQLSFSIDDIRRFRFYAELQKALESEDAEMFLPATRDVSPTEDDKSRLGAYYVIDWVLAHGAAPFTAEEAVAASRALNVKIAPAKELAATAVSSILRLLVKHEFLEEVKRDVASTIVPEAEARRSTEYRLTSRRLAELGHFAAVYEDHRAPVPPKTDAIIGRYRLLDQIGTGGYGSVFRAEDTASGRVVAVKVLSDHLSDNPEAVARFLREARVLRHLRHPSIVHFYEVITEGDKYAIVMELIEGIELDKLLQVRGALPLSVALNIVRQAADAIAYVQGMGIARTDLKPSNMLLKKDGQLRLLDFGIARPLHEDSEITQKRFLIGTPMYMAPEQITDSAALDLRSDIWTLGVVFYEMLTATPPFSAPEFVDLVQQILHQDAPLPPHQPEAVQAFVQHCLQKNPENRFQTPKELLEALDAIRDPAPVDLAIFITDSISRGEEVERRHNAQTAPGLVPEPRPHDGTSSPTTQTVAVSDRVLPGDPHLIITEPEELAGRVLSIPREGRVTIGRASDAAIVIDHPSLTRYHCEISMYDIRDLNSSNGTFVNDKPARDWTKLADGDIVRLGAVVTIFRHAAQPSLPGSE